MKDPHLPKRQVGDFLVPTLYPHAQLIGARSAIGGDCGAQGACVELVPTRDHLLLVAMAA